MKAILKFNLDEPEDRESCARCFKALDMAIALDEIREMIRRKWKYEDLDGVNAYDVVDAIYELYFDILRERGINLDLLLT